MFGIRVLLNCCSVIRVRVCYHGIVALLVSYKGSCLLSLYCCFVMRVLGCYLCIVVLLFSH